MVAVGDCARDGGLFAGGYDVAGSISAVHAVDLHIRGCPRTPMRLVTRLLATSTASA
jgi:Ni,Fe-hydrogenase III small subunit